MNLAQRFIPIVALLAVASCSSTTRPADPRPRSQPKNAAPQQEAPRAQAAGTSSEGALAIHSFRVPEGFQVDLWAAEPMLANPVAFAIDERGRCFVAETFRHGAGVTDTREHMEWRDDDLACRTVADRVAMYKKYLGDDGVREFSREEDRVRLVEDTDNDGKADRSSVFSDGYRSAATGIGAGVLAREGKVWYTCIPDLWLLEDRDGDGQAEKKQSLHTGYGVHVGYLGHDLHGLRWGPDGRIYFSIGDRGVHVETEGRVIDFPDTGTVLRCNPDGSGLEVVASGFRNPQELVFDEHGNLFTADNDSDSKDQPRWVYVVDGGDSGWRIGYQFIQKPVGRGPWQEERLWEPHWKGQAAWIVPPVANLATGPSGLTIHPGTGFPQRYRGYFFLCDFRADSGRSGIRAFTTRARGASFELVDEHEFFWSVLATDADFGPDGALYVSDWIEGWGKTGKGRIYKVHAPSSRANPSTLEVAALLRSGMRERSFDVLGRLVGHDDMRVRQEAQFELVRRGGEGTHVLVQVARHSKNRLARLHAIWGISQKVRQQATSPAVLVALLADADAEIRAQAAKAVGEGGVRAARARLTDLLQDEAPRVRFFAAMALGKLGRVASKAESTVELIEPLCEMLRANDDADAYLRHAAVMGLTGVGDVPALLERATDASRAVRLGVLLALRRLGTAEIACFLQDSDALVVAEAARAINDVPMTQCTNALAALLGRDELPQAAVLRAINANFRLGGPEHATVLARFVASAAGSERAKLEALEALADWVEPSGLDRVVGLWRPLESRAPEPATQALAEFAATAQSASSRAVRQRYVELLGAYRVTSAVSVVRHVLLDEQQPEELRAAAFASLSAMSPTESVEILEVLDTVLESEHATLRMAGQRVLARLDPERAIAILRLALTSGAVPEQQNALELLSRLPSASVDSLLLEWLERLEADKITTALRLDVVEAAAKREATEIQASLSEYRAQRRTGTAVERYCDAVAGGNPARGSEVFNRTALSCRRCHSLSASGGGVGPDLAGVGKRREPAYILESLVEPGRQITEGYETVVIVQSDGKIVTGRTEGKRDDGTLVRTAAGDRVFVPAKEIVSETRSGASTMPEDVVKNLSMRELRDLVAFLVSLK